MRVLLVFVLSAAAALAAPIQTRLLFQQKQPVSSMQEDCGAHIGLTAQSSGAQAAGTVTAGSPGTTAVIDNRQAGCLDWLVTYSTTTTVTGISLLFQTATDVAGVPGTWSAYAGTINSGVNPNVAATPPWAFTDLTGPKFPFLRLNLTSFTGPGTVQVNLYGWKRRPANVNVVSGGGCPGTIATPCVVVGPTAQGAASTTSPVQIGGIFNTTQPTVTNGQVVKAQFSARGSQLVTPGVEGFPVTGTKTNNNAAPGANNVGVLPCLANAAAPTWTEGDQVVCSEDLAGNTRVISTAAGNGAVLSGQQAVTGSAVALATNTIKSACVKALVSNTINVFVGPAAITTSTGYLLAPGESFCAPLTNTNLLFVIASTTGASVSWIATN